MVLQRLTPERDSGGMVSRKNLRFFTYSSEFDIPRGGGRGIQDTSDQHVTDSGFIVKSPSVAYNLDMSRSFRHFLNLGWVTSDS